MCGGGNCGRGPKFRGLAFDIGGGGGEGLIIGLLDVMCDEDVGIPWPDISEGG